MPARSVKWKPDAESADQSPTTLVALVRQAGRLMVDDLVERLEAAGHPGINASFHPIFENIDKHGTRITELAARADITHQSLGELVGVLEQRGYLERRPDPHDGRARLVCLTAQGQRLVRRALREMQAIEADWQKHLASAGCPNVHAAFEVAVAQARRNRSR